MQDIRNFAQAALLPYITGERPFGYCRITNQAMYRDPSGNKCAIGYFIPDALYEPSMEGVPISELDVELSMGNDIDGEILADIQLIHDYMADGRYREARTLAKDINLGYIAALINKRFLFEYIRYDSDLKATAFYRWLTTYEGKPDFIEAVKQYTGLDEPFRGRNDGITHRKVFLQWA